MLSVVEDLIDEFADLDEREACELLDELGRDLPKIPESVYVQENLVPGCQSKVWVKNHLNDDGTVRIEADSDAFVVKGLIYVVLQLFKDSTPERILSIDYGEIFDRMGVGKLILPQRKNGLYSLVKTIRAFCAISTGQTMHTPHVASPVPALATPTRSIDGVAADFPILQRTLPNGHRPVFLDSGASAQKPRVVIDKMVEVQSEYYANAFRGKYYFGQRVDDEIESARGKVAALLGAERSDEIIFTAGTTMSINLVAQAWGRQYLQAGDEVVITEMEHHANFVPWQQVAKERGATLRVLPITDDGLLDQAALETMLTDRTAMIAVCSMSNVLGTINPIVKITQKAHQHGAKIFVDAAQSVPHLPARVAELGIDFLTFSGHKLYGPAGVGVLYGRRELLEEMNPFLFGGHMIERVGRSESTWAEPPAKFEAGTPPIVPIIGLGAAVDYFTSIGYEAVERSEHELLLAAQDRLGKISGLTIYGPRAQASGGGMSNKGAIVSFTIEGVSTEDLAIRLDDHGVFTRHGHHCAMVLHERLGIPASTRASFGLYNTLDDVEQLASAVETAVQDLRR